MDDQAEDAGAELDIDIEFRRKLAGLRHLPRRERPFALRAARDLRQLALKALRERRAQARYARAMLCKLQKPALG